jgi:two-component system sensor histidine kinase CreC
MVDAAHLFASLIEEDLARGSFDPEPLRRAFEAAHRRRFEALIYNQLKRRVDLDLYVTDERGVVLFDSREPLNEGLNLRRFRDVSLTLQGRYGARSTRADKENERSSIMFVGAPVHANGAIVGMVSVSKPQASMWAYIEETRRRIFLFGGAIFLLVALAAILISHWGSRPIRELTEYARAVRRGERIALPKLGSPDVRTLGHALDEMRDSLEDRKYVESYVQTLTHEMKSPVAAIRGAADLLGEMGMPAERRAHFLANITTETERLQNIIDRLLALSAIESMKTLENPEEIALTELVDEVCAAHRHAFEARGVTLAHDYEGNPRVQGEPFLIEIAINNVLQNALEFSPEGGTVTVHVSVAKDAVNVIVDDEGPGVPGYALDRVFDRFYSLQHPGTGKKSSGLGLCFAKEAAELHGGSATLTNRPEGGARAVLAIRATPW